MTSASPLILGGGPAGAAAAIHALRAGARPIIIERRAPDADPLCGGFLSWKTIEQLESLGLTPLALGGCRVTAMHVFAGNRQHAFRLPAPAMALSRQRLDRNLLELAKSLGAQVRHATATFDDGRITLGDGEILAGDSLFLATGKHDLHGLARPRGAAGRDPLLGLRLRLPASGNLRAMLTGHIELHLFAGGYLGVLLQEDGSANFCMAVRKSRLAAAGGKPAGLFAQLANDFPPLALRLEAMPGVPEIDAIGHIPYGWRATSGQPGIFRLGDQAGVIPSLAGEGIGIALASAECAVRFWREGGSSAAPAFQRAFAGHLRRPLATAGLIAALGTSPMARFPLAMLAAVPGATSAIARLTRV